MNKIDMYCEDVINEFDLDKEFVFVNHGSFGVIPRKVIKHQYRYMEEREKNVGKWFTTKAFCLWKRARDTIADFVGAKPENLVFVQNATTGINTVLKAYPWQPGDEILVTDHTYRAVQNACRNTTSFMKGVSLGYLKIRTPINTEEEVVQMYRNYFRTHPKLKMAVIDHITSATAIKMPVEKLVKVCRDYGVVSVIDGAHAPGQVRLNINDLDADIYIGDLHKWLFTPRGCAILCIKEVHHDWCTPLVTSDNYQKGILMEYFMQGTRDDIPYIVVPEAVEFYNSMGGFDKISSYTSKLLEKATTLLTSHMLTERLKVPKSMETSFMRLLKLPTIQGYEKSWVGSEKLFKDIRDQYNMDCGIFSVDGELYIRLSANIYNKITDYRRVRDVILDLMIKTQ